MTSSGTTNAAEDVRATAPGGLGNSALEHDDGLPEWLGLVLADKAGWSNSITARLPDHFEHYDDVRQGFLFSLFNRAAEVLNKHVTVHDPLRHRNIQRFIARAMDGCSAGPGDDKNARNLHAVVWAEHRRLNRLPITDRDTLAPHFAMMLVLRGVANPPRVHKAMTALAGLENALSFPFRTDRDILPQLRQEDWKADLKLHTDRYMLEMEKVIDNVVRLGRAPVPSQQQDGPQ